MTTPAEVALDLSETSRAIARWSLPATLIERLPDETAVQTWTTLHRSVVENSNEGLRLARELIGRGQIDQADEVIGRVQRRWALWLRQVRDAGSDPLIVTQTVSERVSAAMERYYDTVSDVAAAAADLPSTIASGLRGGAALALGAGVIFLMLSRR